LSNERKDRTVLTHDYSYDTCLQGSVRNAWTVDDCFRGRDFDFTKPFLPERIAGVNPIGCLDKDEKRLLNQIRGNSYCHIFAFVEEYIVPLVVDRARADVYGDETRLWSLLRFAEEEVKHQQMLRRACQQFEAGFGVSCGLVPGREAVAGAVLSTSPLTALLLTSMIEWFTQLHYLEHVRDSEELDEVFRDILRFHWIDESRHARMDSLLIDEITAELTAEQKDQAVSGLLELGGAVDGLLARQVELDIDALEQATRRSFTPSERDEIRIHQQRAYRWTFLVSGLDHPNFVGIVSQLSPTGRHQLAQAATALSA
jgi:P-aminobenzoate N-oxygenase AurF